MRHILERKKEPYKPTPSFEGHSKFFVGIITIIHPFISYICLKIGFAIALSASEIFNGLSKVYSEDPSMDKFKFNTIANSGYLYPVSIFMCFFCVALLAGMFEIFRIRSFWVNFLISAILLLIGFFIFLPTFINR